MKNQQAAEREEQQRIKNLVLNYDLHDVEDQDGDSFLPPLLPNPNIHSHNAGSEKAAAAGYARLDKSGNNRSGQRVRKLQLSDVDWYDSRTNSNIAQKYPRKLDSKNSGSRSNASDPGPVPQSVSRQPRAAWSTGQVTKVTNRNLYQENTARKSGASAMHMEVSETKQA